ncbi:MAG: biopolymer transport protein ExbD [Planctomycetota bacterium]|jgi:biopolymer transport protein ExbD
MPKSEDPRNETAELEMTPMIDVTFLLLIFFICTLRFKTLEASLETYLPKEVGLNLPNTPMIEEVEVVIRVVAPGTQYQRSANGSLEPHDGKSRLVYGSDRVVRYSVGIRTFDGVDDIGERLQELHQAEPERPFSIDARRGTTYEEVVEVLDAAAGAGFEKVSFVGAYPEAGQ